MIYFSTKHDLLFLTEFRQRAEQLWALEAEATRSVGRSGMLSERECREAILDEVTATGNGKALREQLAKDIPRASRIARKNGVSVDWKSLPPPITGGAIIPVNAFRAILQDTSYRGIEPSAIRDVMNMTIGTAEERLKSEFFHLINPFYWLLELLIFVLRIPFYLVSATGFDVSKIEDHLLAKLFKLAEMIVIVYVLLWLGLEKTDIAEYIKPMLRFNTQSEHLEHTPSEVPESN
jgi:hypothetical protein